jgi:hypothetical protein
MNCLPSGTTTAYIKEIGGRTNSIAGIYGSARKRSSPPKRRLNGGCKAHKQKSLVNQGFFVYACMLLIG